VRSLRCRRSPPETLLRAGSSGWATPCTRRTLGSGTLSEVRDAPGEPLALLGTEATDTGGTVSIGKEAKMADDVQVANRRCDASENDALIGMARMGADAFGYTADLRIDRGLAQLLRLRVSQLTTAPTA
jgi:hypothetical protein